MTVTLGQTTRVDCEVADLAGYQVVNIRSFLITEKASTRAFNQDKALVCEIFAKLRFTFVSSSNTRCAGVVAAAARARDEPPDDQPAGVQRGHEARGQQVGD